MPHKFSIFNTQLIQPFVITDILGVKKIGDIVGTLGFADVFPRHSN
jgi:hypothetical protein